MLDRLAQLPSLPPEIDGKVHGLLRLEMGQAIWVNSSEAPLFRLKFWGERSPGVILRAADGSSEEFSNTVTYTIRCTQPIFINYLNDMGFLELDVIDSQWRFLGKVRINLKIYFRKDPSNTRGNWASNFGFSNLEIQGSFPMMNNDDKIGDIQIRAKTDFHAWFRQRKNQEVLDSFQVNEIKAEIESQIEEKDRNAERPMETVHQEKNIHEARNNHKMKIREQKQLMQQEIPQSREIKQEAYHQNQDKRDSAKNMDNLSKKVQNLSKKNQDLNRKNEITPKTASAKNSKLDEIKARGEKLKKRLEGNEKPQEPAHDKPIPSSVEVENYQLPFDPTVTELKPAEPRTIPQKSFKKLKISVHSLKLILSQKEVRDNLIYLEGTVPVHTNSDSFKIHHKGKKNNILTFDHESWHNIDIGEDVLGKLANQKIRFRLIMNDQKGKPIELGSAEISWEKILLAPGFSISQTFELTQVQENAKTKGKKPSSKAVGKLSVDFDMSGSTEKPKPKKEMESDSKSKTQLKSEEELVKEKPQMKLYEPIEYKSLQMYLYIESASQLFVNKKPNLYISYKSFSENEKISTPVMWGYQEGSLINHSMLFPLTTTQSIISKLSQSSLILEVWDKDVDSDKFLGICKLPLHSFGKALSSDMTLLMNNVYPLIAVDEHRAISNLSSSQDVGFLRVCLAMGTSLQVHRLQMSHKPAPPPSPKKEMHTVQVLEPTEIKPEVIQEEEEEIQEENVVESPQKEASVEKFEVNESIESIGNIASLLNKQLTDDEIIDKIITALENESLNLEEELQSADRHSYGYMHPESFIHLMTELRLGLSVNEIERLIGIAMNYSGSSNMRRLMFSDILSVLRIKRAVNVNHSFSVTVQELIGCPLLAQLPPSSVYLKYLFPQETSYVESDLLDYGVSIPIQLEARHTCTLDQEASLADTFSPACLGVQFLLCKNLSNFNANSFAKATNRSDFFAGDKNTSQYDEQVIARGLLPVEELIDMNSNETQNRVICLYGDRKEAMRNHRNDIIGKLKVKIQYSAEETSKETGRSTELVFEKKTEIQRMLPKNNTLTIYFDSLSELERVDSYYKEIGVPLENLNLKVRFTCFSQEIDSNYKQFDSRVVFAYKNQLPLVLNEELLEYMKSSTALVELIGVFQDEELSLASAKISLVPLLLNSLISGEFALLNDYGQFMGCVKLSLSFLNDDFIPQFVQEPEESIEEMSEPVQESPAKETSVVQEESPLKEEIHAEECVEVQLTVASAMNLPRHIENNPANLYVKFQFFSQDSFNTFPTRNSHWNSSFNLALPVSAIRDKRCVLFEIWHRSTEDSRLGECPVDLSSLANVSYIDGWYHISDYGKEIGQLKVKIMPLEDVYLKLTGKFRATETDFINSFQQNYQERSYMERIERNYYDTSDRMIYDEPKQSEFYQQIEEYSKTFAQELDLQDYQQIKEKHRENMYSLDSICQNLSVKPPRNTSPLRNKGIEDKFNHSEYKYFSHSKHPYTTPQIKDYSEYYKTYY